ncbi:MAG TPA: GNAT family N-acetyltransferase [Candidatus Elarobacter sp.]|nr:GNAT family N-acetyltransferase [Candidatus Elarobacter sp.]
MATAAVGRLEIRALAADGEDPKTFAALARLMADAYPIMGAKTADELARFAERMRHYAGDPGTSYVVAERAGALVGVMRLYDYVMNVRGTDRLTGGVGSVAVSLAHKRQGIARALLTWYIDHYRARNAPFAILWPYRPDFYRAIGFGYGTPMHRFRFAPGTLRDDGARGNVRLLDERDVDALLACDERVRARSHGLVARHRTATERLLSEAAVRYVGVEDGAGLRGFMQTSAVSAGDRMRNTDEMIVRDMTYEDAASQAALLGFLRAQRDQFARVVVETQDEALYLISDDPRDGSDLSVLPPAAHRVAETGLGLMYRILDVPAALATLPASPTPFTLRLNVKDTYYPATNGAWTFRFGPNAAPQQDGVVPPDVTLSIGIAELSSVVLGSLRLRDAVANRLATLEPADKLALLDAAFRSEEKPRCNTRF